VGRKGRNGEARKREKIKIKKWVTERKLEQETSKQIDILTEWKRDIGNKKLKTMKKVKIKIEILY
jgi:hypothetical protein